MRASTASRWVLVVVGLVWGCGDDDGAMASDDAGLLPSADGGAADDATPDAREDDAAGDVPDADGDGRDATARDAGPVDGGLVVENVPGRHDHTFELEGETREVIVYVPELARGDVAAPVVLMLHGTSGDGERFFNISGWREKADEEGLIAVFPSALTYCFFEDENGDGDYDDMGERKVTTKWSSGVLEDRYPLCTAEDIAMLPPDRRALVDHPLRDDVAYFDAVLDLLGSTYVIDERRIYATGFSNGGSMTSRLAVERSTRFAAIASAAGFLSVDPVAAERSVPMVLSVGSLDDRFTVPLGIMELSLEESLITTPAMAALIDRYQIVLGLGETYAYEQRTVAGQRISRFTWTESTSSMSAELQFAVLEGLHHQYPNGDNYPVPATTPLWEFFSAHTLP
ncbi:MAG: prolyl oligopeptidase family serine peptidase [Deltaproteobacteria bacterium]|nr:prolyl oligopeptidase family serine peptidase [Deltaproteobacteria bacterium]